MPWVCGLPVNPPKVLSRRVMDDFGLRRKRWLNGIVCSEKLIQLGFLHGITLIDVTCWLGL